MRRTLVVTGTDTGIGKTVAAAALVAALGADYWKPIQAGFVPESDTDAVRRLTGAAPGRLHPEAYRLATPASPHSAAAIEGIAIDPRDLTPPESRAPLVIEGAGGLLVPLTASLLQIDLFRSWGFPLVLCSATRLGTINHTLLSVDALRQRGMPLLGIIFIGDPAPDTEATIARLSGATMLGRLPWLAPLTAATLGDAARDSLALDVIRQDSAREGVHGS